MQAMMPSQHQRDLSVRDQEIARLQNQVNALSNQLESAMQQQQQLRRYPQQSSDRNSRKKSHKRTNKMSPHAVHIQHVDGGKLGSNVIRTGRQRMGRNASFYTQRVMASLTMPEGEKYASNPIIMRIMNMFERPNENVEYLRGKLFATDLFKLCQKVRQILEREPRVVYLQSPCYIFGDIHGNLEDLHFFSDNIWRLGMNLTAGNFLFLGDYVDRGMNCLAVVAYLLAMKLQNPQKVFLLRGNHETRDVNGWEEHYGERSFIWQCQDRFDRFGGDIGYRIWEACNQVFDRLPLAAVVDQDIFCVHGGIPRPVCMGNPRLRGASTTRIQDILNVPKVAGINPPYEHEDDVYQQVASDCIWSDPASEEQERISVDPHTGYGESLRGGGAICFGNKAVTDFLQEQGFSYIMRAHEAHAEGVAVSKGARVFTVFSTSKDHNQGSQALAGCILVDDDRLQVINRSPAYKNQYVHRRDSLSLQTLSHLEIAKRIKLGLVTPDDTADYEQSDDESWDDQAAEEQNPGVASTGGSDDDSIGLPVDDPYGYRELLGQQGKTQQEQQYTFAQGRRSSIDLSQMSTNLHDSQSEINMELSASSIRMGSSSRSLQESLRSNNDIIHQAVAEGEDNNEDEDSTVNGDDLDADADVSMEN